MFVFSVLTSVIERFVVYCVLKDVTSRVMESKCF